MTSKQPKLSFALTIALVLAGLNAAIASNIPSSSISIYNFPSTTLSSLTDQDLGSLIQPPSNLRFGNKGTQVATSSQTTTNRLLLNNILQGSSIVLTNPQVVIDLGKETTVHRVYLSGTNHPFKIWDSVNNQYKPPLGMFVVYVGDSMSTLKHVADYLIPFDAGSPVDADAEIRFSPAVGRYVALDLQTNVTWGITNWPGFAISNLPPAQGLSLDLAHLEISGFQATNLGPNAVVCASNAPAPLALAALELSHYLGELSGTPHPIITPDKTNLYSGTIYRIVDLKPLAPDYSTMMSNIANGSLPGGVNVEKNGREVVFRAWPYRAVLWSVWEFLERQGVRWVYPDPHGDSVPTGRGVDLSIVPLKYTPVAKSIYANWEIHNLQPWPVWNRQSYRQEYLYAWRNRWNATSGGGLGPLSSGEVPAAPKPAITLNPDYTEGFAGYPHNFNNVIPTRILTLHSNWWGYSPTSGTRISPTNSSAPAFCMDNPELIQWVGSKMVAYAAANPIASTAPLALPSFRKVFNILPMDGTSYCQCPTYCIPANQPGQPSGIAWVKVYTNSFSDGYYELVNGVAQIVKQSNSPAIVGALAYADVNQPPLNIATFSDNVHVEVCAYGSPNLPMTSPRNSGLKQVLDGWASKCKDLSHYEYTLLHTDYWQTNNTLPMPLVSGIVDRAKYLSSIGAGDGGTQATYDCIPYNPWNFYAYPRIRWNTNQTADQVVQEFISGYFQESSAPMLNYYRAMDSFHTTNNVDLHYMGYCYSVTPGSFPINLLTSMSSNLVAAETMAASWVTQMRLRPIRQGFNQVLAWKGYTNQTWALASSYPTVTGSNGIYSVSLPSMFKPALNPYGNCANLNSSGQWEFLSHGQVQTTLSFPTDGTYQFTISANLPSWVATPSTFNLYAGPALNTFLASSLTFTNFTCTATLPAGAWDITLTSKGGPVIKSIAIQKISP